MFHTPMTGSDDGGQLPFARLSPPARSAWAKHDRKTGEWLPLWRHMADSGAVAAALWHGWLPCSVRQLVSSALPGGEDDARRLVRFLAASHDIGKCSPAFACQVEQLADSMRDHGLDMPGKGQFGQDRRMAPHGLAGQLLIQDRLVERFGFNARTAGQFAVVAGGHHGTPPESQQIHDLRLRPHLLGHSGPSESAWRQAQRELLDGCAELAGVGERLPQWRGVRLPQPVQVLLTAIVILSDWIASAPEMFPYDPETWQPAGPTGEHRRLQAAWLGLDLPAPWAPDEPAASAGELFSSRFPLLASAAIRPVQSEAVRMAREMPEPGLLVIEAPMGEGKTEAALAAAEVLAARSGAGGLLLALPTRATSDAMFRRLLSWLDSLPEDGSPGHSVALAHAKAALVESWAGMLKAGTRSLAAVDLDGSEQGSHDGNGMYGGHDGQAGHSVRTIPVRAAELHAHQWLRGRKKQLLASFAVGTIDQILFAGLKSRHLALRHLAVAGKVVVIDEVHAYDAYMSRYLDRVLEWLVAYRVPVVLLSATLPAARRRALAEAYAVGSGAAVEAGSDAYPLITAVSPGHPVLTARPAAASGRGTEVLLERMDDDLTVLADRIEEELADGGCALVVRNTVNRVLEAADALRARFDDEMVTVTHSRFLAADRAENDADLAARFGPDGARRPERHVVVASQVVEQSLDIDFDLLVTDLAPLDLVLQRVGRLHRHSRPRPARLARARCLVTGVDWRSTPPEPVAGSTAVYGGDYTLLRALAVLDPHLNGAPVELPGHISPLVQRAYDEEPCGPDTWQDAFAEAHKKHRATLAEKRHKAEGFLLGPVRRPGRPVYGWLEASVGDADDSVTGRAQVRDSEETLEVLVVQRRADGRLTTVPWLDGAGGKPEAERRGGLELPEDFAPTRRAAEAVAASALTLPGRFSRLWTIDRTIAELERFRVQSWQVKECPWLAGELLLVLDEHCQTRLSGFDLRYSRADGLRLVSPDMPGDSDGDSTDGEAKREKGEGPGEESDVSPHADAGPPRVTGAVTNTVTERFVTAVAPSARGGAMTGTGAPEEDTAPAPLTYDLVRMPWLPVQTLDGTVEDVSLLDLFARAGSLRRLVGDVPTQEPALLRLLLAILYDALDGPAEIEDWEELWESDDPFAQVPGYLEQHRDRFDLFHPERPFYQVTRLRTAKDEVAPLSRIVADVPNGEQLFAMRRPGVDRLSYGEAARWLVHTHAYDTSGIKSALIGDKERAKAGKVYPLGVGSLGNLGVLFAEGSTLRETLLLNLIALEEARPGANAGGAEGRDMPVWRQSDPLGARPREEKSGGPYPLGLRDLYTWQSRRVRLHAEGGAVTGVVLGYGDPLISTIPGALEPMSAWQRSEAQEKKQGRKPVYTPQRHNPDRQAWRGLAALLPARGQPGEAGRPGDPPQRLRSTIATWFSKVITESDIDVGSLIRLRLVGAMYGTQQSVVDEIVDDSVVLPVVALHEENPVYGGAAQDAAGDAESAVAALGQLAGNLARATGTDPGSHVTTARDLGFGTLDGPYRAWLRALASHPDPVVARQEWQEVVRRHVRRLGRQLVVSASPTAHEGRMADVPGLGVRLVDAGRAELWFLGRLNQVLGKPGAPSGSPDPGEGNGGSRASVPQDPTPSSGSDKPLRRAG
ncbi:type I-E CRISPR-associated protein Cse1/CasA [Streptomyces sp. NPDC048696]|uniref:type I-E CRISPR-associated protein Cse1/CasA n=1 Tax=Streptomyces sp. NPDC048696 TaxID=3365585 RepID=UPI00371A5272